MFGFRVILELKVTLVYRDHLAYGVTKGNKENPEMKAHRVRRAAKVQEDLRDQEVKKEKLENQDLMVNFINQKYETVI